MYHHSLLGCLFKQAKNYIANFKNSFIVVYPHQYIIMVWHCSNSVISVLKTYIRINLYRLAHSNLQICSHVWSRAVIWVLFISVQIVTMMFMWCFEKHLAHRSRSILAFGEAFRKNLLWVKRYALLGRTYSFFLFDDYYLVFAVLLRMGKGGSCIYDYKW